MIQKTAEQQDVFRESVSNRATNSCASKVSLILFMFCYLVFYLIIKIKHVQIIKTKIYFTIENI